MDGQRGERGGSMDIRRQQQQREEIYLSDDNLNKSIDEIFELSSRIGKGSYGCVYKALHRESRVPMAIKKIRLESDLMEILREIAHMQQCANSVHIVKYYGSYVKDADLWIVMEYCGAGSVLDIMRRIGKTLLENEIAAIVCDTLRGLEYLHLRKKIHRDIKSGNILLDLEGRAKLADFGVAGQLSDTMCKRNTVIGTPFWMAPEIVQEVGYDCMADIWSVGISVIEMFEGKPPLADLHPMRAIFMIPIRPAPTLRDPSSASPMFSDFLGRCLVKDPSKRSNATELLEHALMTSASRATLCQLVDKATKAKSGEEAKEAARQDANQEERDDDGTSATMIHKSSDEEEDTCTIVKGQTTRSSTARGTIKSSNNKATEQQKSINRQSALTAQMNESNSDDSDSCDTFYSLTAKLNRSERVTLLRDDDEDDDDSFDGRTLVAASTTTVVNKQQQQLPAQPASTKLSSDASKIKETIRKEIRAFDSQKSLLDALTRADVELRLRHVDAVMEQELAEMSESFEKKRALVLSAIQLKKKNARVF